MAAEWEWDDTLFQGSAAYYQQGRLPFSERLPSTDPRVWRKADI